MDDKKSHHLGIMYRREHLPEDLSEFSQRVERAGYDELWVVEDCFYGSGIASAAVALANTESIRVGLGIMPAVVRNPVFTAMEIATLARIYPGRFLPGIGHGMAGWMRQIGAFPKSQLKSLEEISAIVRRVLAGENVSYEGEYVQLDQAVLVHPPVAVPPISLGVRGAKSLRLSGQVADGTILAEFAAPAYISWAREQISAGQQDVQRTGDHRLTVFAFACVASETESARRIMRPKVAYALARGVIDAQIAPLGILPEVQALLARGGSELLESEIPDEWIDQLVVAGTPADCKRAVQRLHAAGADSVVLVPLPDRGIEELDVFADAFL